MRMNWKRIMMPLGVLLFGAMVAIACSDSESETGNTGDGDLPAENVTVRINPNKTRVLRNPLNGWVLYLAREKNETFWEERGYDHMYVPDLAKYVKVSDYASSCYLRTNWKTLEPQKGKYAWDDPSSDISRIIKSVHDRGLRIALRVLVDGRDQKQNTPEFVFDEGCKWYNTANNKCPYPDDQVFQKHYGEFIEAFARQYNDPDKVDFIDGYGLGKWGESHAMIYANDGNKFQVMEWITALYARHFTKVPLVINYHRMLGDTYQDSWQETVPPDAEPLLNIALNNGYILRHDAFGMSGYYKDWEKNIALKYRYKLPIIMEGGWVTDTHRYWYFDDAYRYREGHPEDVRKGEFEDSMLACVNTMDFRLGETESWFEKTFSYVQRFIAEGGYRLYPDMVSLPVSANGGQDVTVVHRWRNMGWGYCPTNIRTWNQKYQGAFAWLNDNNEVKKIFVDEQTDLSTWLKEAPTTYTTKLNLKGVSVGAYSWAVGLVDVTKDNEIGLEMAVNKDANLLDSGWLKLQTLTVK